MVQNAIGPFVVTADDGRMFHCSLEIVGREQEHQQQQQQQQRWIFRDSRGAAYLGPLFNAERTAEEVRVIVAKWWTSRDALDDGDQNTLMTRSPNATP